MKKCFIYVVAAISALVVSCNKEIDTPEQIPAEVDQNLVPMTFKAALEGDDTKTTLDISDGTVAWAATDQVNFIWELDKTPDSAVSSNTEIDGDVATFTATVPSAFNMTEDEYKGDNDSKSLHLYAVYPSSVVVDYSNNPSFYLTIPTTQDGTFAKASIAIAKWNKTDPSAALAFNNVCGLLQIVIADDNVRKIVLHSDDYIAGKVNYSVNDMKPVAADSSPSNDLKKDITINVSGAGTYYVAVLPTCEDPKIGVTNMYVELFDSSGKLIGNKATTNALSVARKQIRKLGTIATGFDDRFYVKTDGTGYGTSWDDAASYASLSTPFTANTKKTIYMAAGEYTATEIAPGTSTTSANVTIMGGYPSSASGHDISRRNVTANQVVLNANSANRIWVLQRGKWYIDGITFKNAARTGSDTGSALVIEGNASASFVVRNCKFTGNANTGTVGGGAVRVSGSTVKMYGCSFSENTSAKDGAAIYVNSTGTLLLDHCTFTSNASSQHGGAIAVATGSLTAVNCDFESNTAATSAGTIYIKGSGTAKFNLCTFRSNVANGTANTNGGGVAWVTETGKLYMNRCFMANNQDQYNAHAIYSGANSWVGINNCVIRGPFAVTKTQGSVLQIKGSNVIVNSTLYSQTGSWGTISLGSKTENGCRVINSIVINNASSQRSFHCTSYYIQAYNSIYSVANNATSGYGVTDPESSCISGASARSGGNFPTSALEWGYNGAIKNGERFDLDGDRYIYVYPWEGTTDAGTVVYNSLSGIKTLIGGTANIGTDFLSWLESDDLKVGTLEALAMDIRGKARNTSTMWPGSYEETATKASIQNFNVK